MAAEMHIKRNCTGPRGDLPPRRVPSDRPAWTAGWSDIARFAAQSGADLCGLDELVAGDTEPVNYCPKLDSRDPSVRGWLSIAALQEHGIVDALRDTPAFAANVVVAVRGELAALHRARMDANAKARRRS